MTMKNRYTLESGKFGMYFQDQERHVSMSLQEVLDAMNRTAPEERPKEKPQGTLVELAELIAREAHHGQTRQLTGEPYANHPARVAGGVAGSGHSREVVAAAWLHDVLEDTQMLPETLLASLTKCAGSTASEVAEVVRIVMALTRSKDIAYEDYIVSLLEDPQSAAVKISDLQDNLRDLPPAHKASRTKYTLALRLLRLKQEREKLASLGRDIAGYMSCVRHVGPASMLDNDMDGSYTMDASVYKAIYAALSGMNVPVDRGV